MEASTYDNDPSTHINQGTDCSFVEDESVLNAVHVSSILNISPNKKHQDEEDATLLRSIFQDYQSNMILKDSCRVLCEDI